MAAASEAGGRRAGEGGKRRGAVKSAEAAVALMRLSPRRRRSRGCASDSPVPHAPAPGARAHHRQRLRCVGAAVPCSFPRARLAASPQRSLAAAARAPPHCRLYGGGRGGWRRAGRLPRWGRAGFRVVVLVGMVVGLLVASGSAAMRPVGARSRCCRAGRETELFAHRAAAAPVTVVLFG